MIPGMSDADKPNDKDIGAAMMQWYSEAIAKHPDGLVSQAQAAAMLGVSRMAVMRLVARGYLGAVYFPKPPDVQGLAIGQDDPTWLKVLHWLALTPKDAKLYKFPEICYVAFGDVKRVWHSSGLQEKCKRYWPGLGELFRSPKETEKAKNKRLAEHRRKAEEERRGGKDVDNAK